VVIRDPRPAYQERLGAVFSCSSVEDTRLIPLFRLSDIIRSAWQQKGALIREVFKKTRKPPRQAIPEEMPNGPSKLRLSSSPFEENIVHPAHAILPEGPLVESPIDEAQTLDLERSPTAGSVISTPSPKDREKHGGKLGKLVGKLKAKTTNRHHPDA